MHAMAVLGLLMVSILDGAEDETSNGICERRRAGWVRMTSPVTPTRGKIYSNPR